MSRILLYLIINLIAVCQYGFGQGADTLHTQWVNNDINIVKALEGINKSNPSAIEAFFLQFDNNKQRDTLGFGWTMLSHGKGAGYIGVYADFYYYKGKIVSYQLYSRAPSRKELKEQYRTMFAKLLPIDSNGFYYYKFNEATVRKPLSDYINAPGKHIATTHLVLMSPAIGTTYGIGGGMPPSTLPNRQMFSSARASLSKEEVIAMMYAINPATRLMAFEYYINNKNKFTDHSKIESWMMKVYKEIPLVQTINGCFILHDRSDKLVERFSKVYSNTY